MDFLSRVAHKHVNQISKLNAFNFIFYLFIVKIGGLTCFILIIFAQSTSCEAMCNIMSIYITFNATIDVHQILNVKMVRAKISFIANNQLVAASCFVT